MQFSLWGISYRCLKTWCQFIYSVSGPVIAVGHFIVTLAGTFKPLCCCCLIWPIQNDAKSLKNDWNPDIRVLIWKYSARAVCGKSSRIIFSQSWRILVGYGPNLHCNPSILIAVKSGLTISLKCMAYLEEDFKDKYLSECYHGWVNEIKYFLVISSYMSKGSWCGQAFLFSDHNTK